MALTVNHPALKETSVYVYCTSIGATPVACYTSPKIRGRISKVQAVTQGAITTGDCAVALAVNGTTNAALAGTIPVASAAAGQVVSWVPTSAVYVLEDDSISITPSGASGSSIGCMFRLDVQMG